MRIDHLICPFIATMFLSSIGSAQVLSFPLEKNGIKVLPQRFEYQLVDKDQFRIGDILIDAAKFDFQFIPVDIKQSRFRLRFRWSAGLLTDGDLVIKDNAGKSVWTQKMDSKQIQITEQSQKEESPYRTSLAMIETPVLDKEVFQKLRYTAFFKLCIIKTDEDTKIYMCSKDLFLRKTSQSVSIESRDSFRRESFVEINGRPVDPQGAIFLNERTDTISMRALMMSGATLEVSTRRKDIFFKDVALNEAAEKLLVRAVGTEPVSQNSSEQEIKYLGEQDWQVELPSDRPAVYLKGEGGIPLKQEFMIQGNVRKDSLQIKVIDGWAETTYSSEIRMELQKSSPDLKLTSTQKNSVVSNETSWLLKDLEVSNSNRRFLNVEAADGKYVAAFDVYRGTPYEVSSKFMYPFFSESEGQWWMSKFRWGLGLKYEKLLLKKSSDPDFSNLEAWAHFRFNPGLHMKDPTVGAGIIYDSISFSPAVTLTGLDFFSELKCPEPLNSYFEWWLTRLRVPLSASGSSGASLKMSYDFEASLRHYTQKTTFVETGLRLGSYTFSTDAGDFGFSRSMVFLGIGLQL